MSRRPTASHHLDTDGLQADVMRFMAIIAFCLIAMLALVKNLDGPSPEEPQVAETVEPMDAAEVAVRQVAEAAEAATVAEVPVAIETHEATPVTPRSQKVEKAGKAEDEALTFRFASERDFLHLLATDEVQLYASTSTGFARLNNDFTLTDERPREEVFEVMPHSVPPEIERIFRRAGRDPVYLVDLPPRTRAELRAFLDSIDPGRASGALVIHADGHITHETKHES